LAAWLGDIATLLTTIKTSIVAAINELHADFTALAGGSTISDATLIEWTEGEDYELTAITRDADGVPTTATVKWPDAGTGTFTTDTRDDTWLAIKAYHITHVSGGVTKTVTQTAVTRDANGAITAKPVLTIV
jgi:hypothetical protein